MKNKKSIIYYCPTIILLIYAILYMPLFRIVYSYMTALAEMNTAYNMIAPYQISDTMNGISNIVVILSIIIKIFFNAKKCEISKTKSVINVVIFVILILFIMFFLRLATSFA